MKNQAQQRLVSMFRAKAGAVAIRSLDERRTVAAIAAVADSCNSQKGEVVPLVWRVTKGITTLFGDDPLAGRGAELKDPSAALGTLLELEGRQILVMLDAFSMAADNPMFRRVVRDTIGMLNTRSPENAKLVVFLETGLDSDIPELPVMDWPLPSREELQAIVTSIAENPTHSVDSIVDAAAGLTASQAEGVFARSLVERQMLDPEIIREEKKAIIESDGLLEIIQTTEDFSSIGGLDLLKSWLIRRKEAFSPEARAFGIARPKGVLLTGVPGCGKSLSAKAVAKAWELPLVRLDVGRLFGKYVGDTEGSMRRTMAVAEATAPMVLWIDEIEKALPGDDGGDAGVSTRVMGAMLTWMQECQAPVFFFATANAVEKLPPELLRKGRFDEIFHVDLPTTEERCEILAAHLVRRGRPGPGELNGVISLGETQILAELMADFSGAEIESVVASGLLRAYYDGGVEVGFEHLQAEASGLTPLAVTAPEKIKAIRAWGRGRARLASTPEAGDSKAVQMSDRWTLA